MSKPIHPATVHFPLAFLTLAYGLDILHALTPNLPRNLTSSLPPSADITRASYYLLSLGLITAIPAVMSGGQQAVAMISKQGMYEQDGKTLKEKVKATFAHAIANDVVIAISAYIWYCKRSAASETLAGKLGMGSVATPAAAYAPEMWMVGAQAVIAALFLFAASIGGALTYNYGVGFSAAKSGGAKKSL